MIKCTLCKKFLRIPYFPLNLFFWRPKGLVYTFDTEVNGQEYNVITVLCQKDVEYVNKNPLVGQSLILARIHRLDNDE